MYLSVSVSAFLFVCVPVCILIIRTMKKNIEKGVELEFEMSNFLKTY